jgi:hypothetical protein
MEMAGSRIHRGGKSPWNVHFKRIILMIAMNRRLFKNVSRGFGCRLGRADGKRIQWQALHIMFWEP